MGFLNARLLAFIAFPVLLASFSVHAASQVEGRIPGSGNGSYDILLDVWEKAGSPEAKPRLLQTIRIPRVSVVEGRFRFSVDAGLDGHKDGSLSYEIRFRPFEAWKPYQLGEVSSVLIAAL
jgi:hypothetical protein